MMKDKNYTEEFKANAVRMVLVEGLKPYQRKKIQELEKDNRRLQMEHYTMNAIEPYRHKKTR